MIETMETRNLVVVTGIGGFLGRHVAASLLRQGFDVRGTVRSLKNAAEIEAESAAQKGLETGN
ncbi:NAD-dependent epimerase/dehydratase family protein [Rhizobium sp. 32-5/1]|uniref:NAD-dependent epimerase/dehydratase family protein n=1 Tax=Rhizobium sp. 32-5/1 TaxID=3019602 RepID=UPI00240E7DA6|nr:NAD-dependent epimerase/dehydratase family protein [Rhizobium sp. 32-5/1]WEZ83655.1 NAD-dependent epimerase/dehydratase family protein [Rhizobium sp. 32-5/1]